MKVPRADGNDPVNAGGEMIQVSWWFHVAVIACYTAGFALAFARIFLPRVPRWTVSAAVLAGLAAQAVLMGMRWNASNHFPVTGLFETLHFLAFWVAGVTLYFGFRYGAERFLPAGLGLAVVALSWAGKGKL